jgi:hypothetical protein
MGAGEKRERRKKENKRMRKKKNQRGQVSLCNSILFVKMVLTSISQQPK